MHTITFQHDGKRGRTAFERLAELQHKIREANDNKIDLKLLLDKGNSISPTFIFLLGCFPDLFSGKAIQILTTEGVLRRFSAMKILDYYNSIRNSRNHMKMCFREITEADYGTSLEHIIDDAPVKLTPKLAETLKSSVFEIGANVFEHSKSSHCFFGQYSKGAGNKNFCFAIYDNGIGIPASVYAYFRTILGSDENIPNIDDIILLNWAIIDGNTTKASNKPRGLGLGMLKSFANANSGTLTICSGRALYVYENGRERKYKLRYPLIGTFLEMYIKSDSTHRYKLGIE